jgi:hypothetical protein
VLKETVAEKAELSFFQARGAAPDGAEDISLSDTEMTKLNPGLGQSGAKGSKKHTCIDG